MQHRLTLLTGRYPHLLTPSAWEKAFTTMPMDVRAITSADVEKAVLPGEQWLVVAGWECQDLSPAGVGKGLRGNKSSTYYQLLQLLNNLQGAGRQKGNPALAYVLENTAFQYHWSQDVAERDFAAVCEVLGTPLEVDAARFGSRAHRLRNFWTNLGDTAKVAAAVTCAERPPGLTVQQILEPGRTPMPVAYSSRPPWYPEHGVKLLEDLLCEAKVGASIPAPRKQKSSLCGRNVVLAEWPVPLWGLSGG
jgi:hypothetical protein